MKGLRPFIHATGVAITNIVRLTTRGILDEAARLPSVEREVTAQWSLTRLQKAMRQAVDGLPEVSSETIGRANGKRIEHARI